VLAAIDPGSEAPGVSFDRLARVYQTLETMVFGRALWRACVRYLDEMAIVKNVLVLGDGDGRLLAAFTRRVPGARVIAVDSSAAMLQAGAGAGASQATVHFVCADVRRMPIRTQTMRSFDGFVSHFFLDCLEEQGDGRTGVAGGERNVRRLYVGAIGVCHSRVATENLR
jgi:ubiquinone/menaquinone biosynthesis C-methylase UbiE